MRSSLQTTALSRSAPGCLTPASRSRSRTPARLLRPRIRVKYLKSSSRSTTAARAKRAAAGSDSRSPSVLSRCTAARSTFRLDPDGYPAAAHGWIRGHAPHHERIAHLFCELFMRLKAIGLNDGNSFQMPITQSELADATGLSTVHVNRTMQDLRASGLIKRREVGKRSGIATRLCTSRA